MDYSPLSIEVILSEVIVVAICTIFEKIIVEIVEYIKKPFFMLISATSGYKIARRAKSTQIDNYNALHAYYRSSKSLP